VWQRREDGGMKDRQVDIVQVENGFMVTWVDEEEGDDGWSSGKRVFTTYSDLDSWLARFFADGGGDSV